MWKGAQGGHAGVGEVVRRVCSLLGLASISALHLLPRPVFAVLVLSRVPGKYIKSQAQEPAQWGLGTEQASGRTRVLGASTTP